MLDYQSIYFNVFLIYPWTTAYQFNMDLEKMQKRHIRKQRSSTTFISLQHYSGAVLWMSFNIKRHLCNKAKGTLCDPKQNKGQLVWSPHAEWVETLTKADAWPLKASCQWEVWSKRRRCRSSSIWHYLQGNKSVTSPKKTTLASSSISHQHILQNGTSGVYEINCN